MMNDIELKKFREGLYESYAEKTENGILLYGRHGNSLYEECSMDDLPNDFVDVINDCLKKKHGMGAGLIDKNEEYFFSNTADDSLHKCFKKRNEFPKFKIAIDLSFKSVKELILKDNLEIGCSVRKNENRCTGSLKVWINNQRYFDVVNSTGFEKMDEYFFCKGGVKKILALEFKKEGCYLDNEEELKEDIISTFFSEDNSIFEEKWYLI